MGYQIELTDHDLVIEKKHFPEVMSALMGMNGKGFGYFTTISEEDDIIDRFECARYEVYFNEDGDLVLVDFTGEKFADDDKIWRRLSGFVKPGSYMEWLGEDGATWTVKFNPYTWWG